MKYGNPMSRVLEELGLDAPVERVAYEIGRLGTLDRLGMYGWGFAELTDADSGDLKQRSYFGNLITTNGDKVYASRGSNVSPENVASGMRIGYGTDAVAKSGTGSYISSYETSKGASQAMDGSYPTCAAIGSDVGWRVTYKVTYETSEGNLTSAIAETVVTNESGPTDVQGTAANTISRALVSPTVSKTSSDTLAITWQHDFYDAP